MEALCQENKNGFKGAIKNMVNLVKGSVTIAVGAFAIALCPPIGANMAAADVVSTLCNTASCAFGAFDAAEPLEEKVKEIRKLFSSGKDSTVQQKNFLDGLEKYL